MRTVDVVIVSYAKNKVCFDLTYNCIKSLNESENSIFFKIYVVESKPKLQWSEHFGCDIITIDVSKEEYGYHKFLNIGRKAGSSPYVVLCNNDLIFHKNWCTEILNISDSKPGILSFSPICPKTQPLYGMNINSGLYIGFEIRKHISGWCILQKREIYKIIGDLDESFIHWYCDNWYAIELARNDLFHILVSTSIVEHHPNQIGEVTKQVIDNQDELNRLTIGGQKIFEGYLKKNFTDN